MIVEAGYDLAELVHPFLFGDGAHVGALWVLALDKELRYLYKREVAVDACDSIGPHFDAIIGSLERPWVHYFAIAQRLRCLGDAPYLNIDYTIEERLKDLAAAHGFEFLGHMMFDTDGWYSTGPMYRFRDYYLDNLPLAAVIPGPHPFDCPCIACKPHQRIIQGLHLVDEDDSDA
jgi:hypothetical protein